MTTSGDLDVVVHLTQVDYQIPQLLGERVLQIASPKAAADPAKLDQNPVGAGPFIVTQLVPGTKAVLKKNPDYWDAKNIHIDNVRADLGPRRVHRRLRPADRRLQLRRHRRPARPSAAKKAGLDVFVQPGFNASNISLNINKAPFNNPKVVDAVRYAVNRQEFVDKLTFGYGAGDRPALPARGTSPTTRSRRTCTRTTRPRPSSCSREAGLQAGPDQARPGHPGRRTRTPRSCSRSSAAVGIKVNIKIDKNWATPFFAKDLTFSLYGTTGRDSALQTLTAHFGPNGPLNLSTPYEPAGFEAAVAKVRQTPLDAPDYADGAAGGDPGRAAEQGAGLHLLARRTSSPRASRSRPCPANPGHIDWTGVTIGGTDRATERGAMRQHRPAAVTRPTTGAARSPRRVLVTLGRSVAIFVPVFLVATFVTFALRSLSGLSPARIQLGEEATPEAIAPGREPVGAGPAVPGPVLGLVQRRAARRARHQLVNGADISTLIGLGLGVSLSVATLALVIGVVVGFGLGTLAALRRTTLDRPGDHRLRHGHLGDAGRSSSASCWSRCSRSACGWFPSAGYVPLGGRGRPRGSRTSCCRRWR